MGFPRRLAVPVEPRRVLQILADEGREAKGGRQQEPHPRRRLVTDLGTRAGKRRPAVNDLRYEPLAVGNAPVDAVGSLAHFERDVAGALPATPDDNGLAGIFRSNRLHGGAVQDRPGKAFETRVCGDIVLMLMHPRRNDEALRTVLRTIRAGDVPNVAELARVADRMVEADVPIEIEAGTIVLQISEDFEV